MAVDVFAESFSEGDRTPPVLEEGEVGQLLGPLHVAESGDLIEPLQSTVDDRVGYQPDHAGHGRRLSDKQAEEEHGETPEQGHRHRPPVETRGLVPAEGRQQKVELCLTNEWRGAARLVERGAAPRHLETWTLGRTALALLPTVEPGEHPSVFVHYED